MSILLKTIEAFPRGRTTNELMVLLDVAFDGEAREAVRRELADLQTKGVVSLGYDRRWRTINRPRTTSSHVPSIETEDSNNGPSDLLVATPANFTTRSVVDETSPDEGEVTKIDDFEPSALLRYYKSALQHDPRGALTQTYERHGVTFQLLSGTGSLFPASDDEVIVRVQAENLPAAFREALIRRDGEDNGVALGWPLDIGRKFGALAIRPVGLLAAVWSRKGDFIELRVETDDVLVNPDWVASRSRTTPWSRTDLQRLFRGDGVAGLPGEEFLGRLREAAAGAVIGRLNGYHFTAMIETGVAGIHNGVALFLPSSSTFTAGAVRDLDNIATWETERLGRTALASLIGLKHGAKFYPVPPINTGQLNMEQIKATAQAMRAPLSVITGPPGTGKSQVIVAIAATALWAGQTVIVASKNHQALDSVEQRLSDIAPGISFIVRTLDPSRDLDCDVAGVLHNLVSDPSGSAFAPPDLNLTAELNRLARIRSDTLSSIVKERLLRTQLAEDLERLRSRKSAGLPGTSAPESSSSSVSFWHRFLSLLGLDLGRKSPSVDGDLYTTEVLRKRIVTTRDELSQLGSIEDPVSLTKEISTLAQRVLGPSVAKLSTPDDQTRMALSNAYDDLQLQGVVSISRVLARRVLQHRPLWLASVLGVPKRIPLEDGLFDLVIFDEASQCDIGSALPVLARARRAVIVGDNRQLAFIPQLGIAQDRNLMSAQGLRLSGMGRFAQSRKSLFDLARSSPDVPAVMLREQYRSAVEIVRYINQDFYGGRLRVAAVQEALRVPRDTRPGIHWTHVLPATDVKHPGTNSNSAETHAIVKHLEELLLNQNYKGSVGVISPFRPQVAALAEAISAYIPESRQRAADMRVGTIDSFQGQERDLILFSPVVHSRIAQTAIQFLNRDWRRLNVAISRARAVAHIFGDLEFARRGTVRRLQRLAALATEPPCHTRNEGTFDSEWERLLYERLRSRGFDPKPQYEIAGRRLDFALFSTNGTKLDVEVDGRIWHQDIDGNRKLGDHWRDHQLKSLGWKVRRFWVDELDNDMEGCIDIIRQDLS